MKANDLLMANTQTWSHTDIIKSRNVTESSGTSTFISDLLVNHSERDYYY